MDNLFELTKKLCDLNGVSGREAAVADEIEKLAKPYADEIKRDALGNLLVYKKGRIKTASPLMFDAHTDEVGFLVSHITDKGFLKLVPVGGLYGHTLSGRTLFLTRAGIKGVLGKAPIHHREKEDENKVPKLDGLYLDIGASSKEEAEKYVRLGDECVFDTELRRLGDDSIIGKAIDDRLGCALLLKLLEKGPVCDCCFAFDVQEELGLRGAGTAAFGIRPEYAVAVDCCGAADNAGFKENDRIAQSGKGPVISFIDYATAYDKELFDKTTALAEKNGIAWQTKSRISGGTDAGSIHKSASGVKVIGVSVASRNIHTAASTASLVDAENTLELLKLIPEMLYVR